MNDPFKKLFSAARNAAGQLAGNTDLIINTMKSQFTAEGLKALMEREMFLSGQILDRELRKHLGDENRVDLEPIRCLEDRIVASAAATALHAKVAGNFEVRVHELRLDRETQHLCMSMLSETYKGGNFLGSCAVAVGGLFLKSLLRTRVRKSELGRVLEFEDDNKVILKLGELDAIKSLTDGIVSGKDISVLDLVQCAGAKHVMGGVQVRLGSDGLRRLSGMGDR